MYSFNFLLFIVTMFLLSDIFSIKNNVLCITAYYNMYDNFNEKLGNISNFAQDKVSRMSMPKVYETNNNDGKHSNKQNLNKIKLKSFKVHQNPEEKISRIDKVFNIFQPYYDQINELPLPHKQHEEKSSIQSQLYKNNNNDNDYNDDYDDTENLENEYPIFIENSNWARENKFTVVDLKNDKNLIENVPAAYVENLRKYSCELCSLDEQKMDKRQNCCKSKQLKIKRDTNNEENNAKQTENVLPSSSSSLSAKDEDELLKKSNEQLPISKVIA